MSYIPRSSALPQGAPGAIPKLVKKKHTFRLFGFIASLMIVSAIASVLVSYFYHTFQLGKLEAVRMELKTVAERNSSDDIAGLKEFENKLNIAERLLKNHQSPTKLLKLIEESTKETVRISSFIYTYDPGFQALLELDADTDKLNSLAQQNIELLENTLFTEFVLEGITLGVNTDVGSSEEETVGFSIIGELKKNVFNYNGVPVTSTIPAQPLNASDQSTMEQEVQGSDDVTEI